MSPNPSPSPHPNPNPNQVRPVGAAHEAEAFGATILNAEAGGIVTFPGKLRHGGNMITSGRRCIVPLF